MKAFIEEKRGREAVAGGVTISRCFDVDFCRVDDGRVRGIGLFNDFSDRHARNHRTVQFTGQNETEGALNGVVIEYRSMKESRHDGLKIRPQLNLMTYRLP